MQHLLHHLSVLLLLPSENVLTGSKSTDVTNFSLDAQLSLTHFTSIHMPTDYGLLFPSC